MTSQFPIESEASPRGHLDSPDSDPHLLSSLEPPEEPIPFPLTRDSTKEPSLSPFKRKAGKERASNRISAPSIVAASGRSVRDSHTDKLEEYAADLQSPNSSVTLESSTPPSSTPETGFDSSLEIESHVPQHTPFVPSPSSSRDLPWADRKLTKRGSPLSSLNTNKAPEAACLNALDGLTHPHSPRTPGPSSSSLHQELPQNGHKQAQEDPNASFATNGHSQEELAATPPISPRDADSDDEAIQSLRRAITVSLVALRDPNLHLKSCLKHAPGFSPTRIPTVPNTPNSQQIADISTQVTEGPQQNSQNTDWAVPALPSHHQQIQSQPLPDVNSQPTDDWVLPASQPVTPPKLKKTVRWELNSEQELKERQKPLPMSPKVHRGNKIFYDESDDELMSVCSDDGPTPPLSPSYSHYDPSPPSITLEDEDSFSYITVSASRTSSSMDVSIEGADIYPDSSTVASSSGSSACVPIQRSKANKGAVSGTSTPPSLSPTKKMPKNSPTRPSSTETVAASSQQSTKSLLTTSNNATGSIARSTSSLGSLLARSKSISSFPQKGSASTTAIAAPLSRPTSNLHHSSGPDRGSAPAANTSTPTSQTIASTAHDRSAAAAAADPFANSPFKRSLNGAFARSSLGAEAPRGGGIVRTTSDVHGTLGDRASKKRSRSVGSDHGAEGDEDAMAGGIPSTKISRLR